MEERGKTRRCAMNMETPMLLLMKGHPGSGKSTLARLLAKRLRWALVDKDDARDCLGALKAAVGREELNTLSYTIMWRVADTQLACGNSVIVDCPLARRQLYEAGLRIAQQVGSSAGGAFRFFSLIGCCDLSAA